MSGVRHVRRVRTNSSEPGIYRFDGERFEKIEKPETYDYTDDELIALIPRVKTFYLTSKAKAKMVLDFLKAAHKWEKYEYFRGYNEAVNDLFGKEED